jgi:peroxiredoxin
LSACGRQVAIATRARVILLGMALQASSLYVPRVSAVLAAWLALAVCPVAIAGAQTDGGQRESPRTWHATLDSLAPDFDLPDTRGRTWRLSDQRGRVVVLEWYNPLCPVVGRAHGQGGVLEILGNESVREGVVWVAINSGARGTPGSGSKANRTGAQEMKLSYPVLLDETGWVGRMYGATCTPNLYIIDAAGTLVYSGGHEDRRGRSLVGDALWELKEEGKVSVQRTKAFGCAVRYARRMQVGLVAPDFALECLDGREHRLSSLRGNHVVLEWFNPVCPTVAEAHAMGGALAGMAARLEPEGVRWFAVNSSAPEKAGSTIEEMRAAARRWDLRHPMLRDPTGKVGKAYGARTTPVMFVIDCRGVVIYSGAPRPREGGLNWVEQALDESRAGLPISVPTTKPYGGDVSYER